MGKETFYFQHDYNVRTDDKIKALIRKHKMAGYGIFWSIIEDLYNNGNSLRLDYDGISKDLKVKSSIIKSIIEDFELFVIEKDFFGSISVQKRLEAREGKSAKARESAFRRWEKDANALRPETHRNAIKESKGKEKKEKESKGVAFEIEIDARIEDGVEIIDDIKFNNSTDFEFFWNEYDKKIGDKTKLKKKWDALSERERQAALDYIPIYKSAQPDKQYRKNPETFLNNKSWNDEIISRNSQNANPVALASSAFDRFKQLRSQHNGAGN